MNGTNWTAFGSSGSDANHFKYPAGIALDSIGRILVADMINDRVVRFDDMKGANWTALGGAANQFSHPCAVEVDASGHLCITDTLNSRIVRLVMP